MCGVGYIFLVCELLFPIHTQRHEHHFNLFLTPSPQMMSTLLSPDCLNGGASRPQQIVQLIQLNAKLEVGYQCFSLCAMNDLFIMC